MFEKRKVSPIERIIVEKMVQNPNSAALQCSARGYESISSLELPNHIYIYLISFFFRVIEELTGKCKSQVSYYFGVLFDILETLMDDDINDIYLSDLFIVV